MKYIFILLLLSGCSSLENRAFDIHEGDNESKIIEALGKPRFFLQSTRTPGGMAYYYQKSGFICGFTVKEKIVLYRYCVVDENPMSTAIEAKKIIETNYIKIGNNPTDENPKREFDPDQYLKDVSYRSEGGQ